MSDETPTRYHMTGSGAWVKEAADAAKGKIFDEAKAEALIAEVCERLGKESEAFIEREVTPANMLTNIVLSLEWEHAAAINGFHNDQWSAVTAARHDGTFGTWVECYSLEAGCALTWKLFADREKGGSDDGSQADEG